MRHFLGLVRFSHTLFALPFAISAMLWAARGLPDWQSFGLILFCMVFCRNTAMSFNRWVDVSFDAQNPRTARRHIPSGLLAKKEVLIFCAVNGLAFIVTTWFINPLAFALSIPTLLIVCFYSLTKRFSSWSHLFLGIAIGISPVGAWIAIQGRFGWEAMLLSLSLILWIAGFDIIYATQDQEFDAKTGLHSLVVRYGQVGALRISMAMHFGMMLALLSIEFWFNLGIPFQVALVLVGLSLIYLHLFRRSASLDRLNQDFFLANVLISLTVFLGISASILFC